MSAPSYVWHIDLATGSGREVYRHDLDQQAVVIARGLLARVVRQPCETLPLPAMEGLSIAGRAGGRCVTLAVLIEGRALQTVAIAAHSRCGAAAWREIAGDDTPPPQVPWCATAPSAAYGEIVGDDAALHLMMQALGSVLAWAWLDYLAARTP